MRALQSSARKFSPGSSVKPETEVKGKRIFLTSYNAEKSQTDNSPCIGASGINQCDLAKKGQRIIALSQDIVGRAGWKDFHYGDEILLRGETTDPRCNGKFIVLDTMNARYTNRGDLFMLSRAQNTSCWATITKL